jgi:hypothetical protein
MSELYRSVHWAITRSGWGGSRSLLGRQTYIRNCRAALEALSQNLGRMNGKHWAVSIHILGVPVTSDPGTSESVELGLDVYEEYTETKKLELSFKVVILRWKLFSLYCW